MMTSTVKEFLAKEGNGGTGAEVLIGGKNSRKVMSCVIVIIMMMIIIMKMQQIPHNHDCHQI